MDELEQAIVEFGWHPDEIKPRDKTWLHERRNWISETDGLRTWAHQLREERQTACEAAETYHAAWQDAATYWKDRVAAMETVLHAAREWRDQYCVNVERGMTGLMRGDELVAILEEYDFNRETKVPE